MALTPGRGELEQVRSSSLPSPTPMSNLTGRMFAFLEDGTRKSNPAFGSLLLHCPALLADIHDGILSTVRADVDETVPILE